MLLRLWSSQKKPMTEVQRQSGPCPRDCKNQIRMKKAGRKIKVSEREKIFLLFWDTALPEDSPDMFSQHFFDSESERSKTTWSSSCSDYRPLSVDSNNIRLWWSDEYSSFCMHEKLSQCFLCSTDLKDWLHLQVQESHISLKLLWFELSCTVQCMCALDKSLLQSELTSCTYDYFMGVYLEPVRRSIHVLGDCVH